MVGRHLKNLIFGFNRLDNHHQIFQLYHTYSKALKIFLKFRNQFFLNRSLSASARLIAEELIVARSGRSIAPNSIKHQNNPFKY